VGLFGDGCAMGIVTVIVAVMAEEEAVVAMTVMDHNATVVG